jgi:hypothetical protein
MRDSLLVRNVTLIDGTGAPPVVGAVVAIEDGRIRAAGRSAGIDAPPDAPDRPPPEADKFRSVPTEVCPQAAWRRMMGLAAIAMEAG